MMAFSTIFVIFPSMFGIGPDSETRNPMAIATVGGIFSSLLLNWDRCASCLYPAG